MQVHSLNVYSIWKTSEDLTLLLQTVRELDAEVQEVNSGLLVVA